MPTLTKAKSQSIGGTPGFHDDVGNIDGNLATASLTTKADVGSTSPRGTVKYPELIRRAMVSGRVGYFARIARRGVRYFGRRGEVHVERFPAGP
jgi:hypothetical protein